jgi:hypothetical protein
LTCLALLLAVAGTDAAAALRAYSLRAPAVQAPVGYPETSVALGAGIAWY